MQYTIAAKGIELSDFNHQLIGEKVGRLEKHLRHPWPVEITFHREGKGLIICALTYGEGKQALHAERSNHSLEQSLDEALEALKRELIKQHEKLRSQR